MLLKASSTNPDSEQHLGILFGGADNLQYEKEDLYNVDVEGESGEHVLLLADGVLPVSYQKLRVICQELEDTNNQRQLGGIWQRK